MTRYQKSDFPSTKKIDFLGGFGGGGILVPVGARKFWDLRCDSLLPESIPDCKSVEIANFFPPPAGVIFWNIQKSDKKFSPPAGLFIMWRQRGAPRALSFIIGRQWGAPRALSFIIERQRGAQRALSFIIGRQRGAPRTLSFIIERQRRRRGRLYFII